MTTALLTDFIRMHKKHFKYIWRYVRKQNVWYPNAVSEPEHLQACKIKINKTVVKTRTVGKSSV